jgi:hypothetical protein
MDNPEKLATMGTQEAKRKKKSTTQIYIGDKGNNKITELRTILRRESQNS